MTNHMEEVYKYIQMDRNMKDNLLMGKRILQEHNIDGRMGKSIEVHLKTDIWKDLENLK
jgi:hypothetical protein